MLTTTRQGQWPVTGLWPVSWVDMNFHIETGINEVSEVFTRRKSTVCVDRHTGGLRGSLALVIV